MDASVRPSPLSVRSAASSLILWARSEASRPHPPSHASRLAIPVHPGHPSALAWLRAQRFPQKLFFRSRSLDFEVAAVGFVHHATGPRFTRDAHLELLHILAPDDSTQRFYGAARFDDGPNSRRDDLWKPYDGYTFVLPAVELYRDPDGGFHLAANFYPPAGLDLLTRVLVNIVPTPLSIFTSNPAALIPRADRVADLTIFPDWHAAITTILRDLSTGQYGKIVLARRKRFSFNPHASPTPVHILAALEEQDALKTRHFPPLNGETRPQDSAEQRNSYLFCLQLDHRSAFLGCTPERLFRLEGQSILAEALAGTVRRGSDGNEGQVLSELMSSKNLEEHRFVVDYIRTALADCGVQADTNGPHVRRLPRLMHLATHIHGQFPLPSDTSLNGHRADVGGNASGSNVFKLLRTMHPTPAVCGMPREKTITELENLEDFDRGLFAGPLGWFSREAGEFCVAIRSALVHDNDVTAFAGSGIVPASESRSEWDETELKMSAFTDLFQPAVHKPHVRTERLLMEMVTPLLAANLSLHDLHKLENGDTYPYGTCNGSNTTHVRSGLSGLSLHENSLGAPPPSRSGSTNSLDSSYETCNASTPVGPSSLDFDASMLKDMPNLNTLWGCCVIEELCRNHVNTFFVAPGSRSAPLAVGVVRSRHAILHITHDERGAGFLAVGYARATGRAAAVITSSGTAVANLLPAVVEASMDNLPVILLTADRPPELREVGANQAIRQCEIFGSYTLWTKDIPCPSTCIPLRNLLSDIDYAVHKSGSGSLSSSYESGPIHLNMMFREKLAPDHQAWDREYVNAVGTRWQKSLAPLTQYHSTSSTCTASLEGLFHDLQRKVAGVIIVGGGCGCIRTEDEALALYEIAETLRWPVISDVCGGLRLNKWKKGRLVHYADQILISRAATQALVPDAVLQIGERVTSKRVYELISSASKVCSDRDEEFAHVVVSRSSKRCDQGFTVTHRLRSEVSEILEAVKMVPRASGKRESKLMVLTEISDKMDMVLQKMMQSSVEGDELTEPWCSRVISECTPAFSGLFVGNSMVIRDMDAFGRGRADGMHVRISGNRGASGIDGVVSSGIGFGLGLRREVTIVLGDMSLLHDLNALHLLRRGGAEAWHRVTVVVVNNGGGGIFSMLPIGKHRDVFSPVFDTPHSVEFRHACDMFGMQYHGVRSVGGLRDALNDGGDGGDGGGRRHRMIEAFVSGDHGSNAALHQRLGAAVAQQVASFFAGQGTRRSARCGAGAGAAEEWTT
ncbi:unnamed protein product [Chondrus crispus]|uniref:Isochorismate synthase n=1 Tax=Chondrus crispus TaxID=2769 RepID=R7Q8J3_CHOCR|nr:unnamed protein product [Chondrus crispus]CDF33800.1 unnamed protein product [Chondrus crispus]|eukprot:XP_005713619.1 unnamed protein product [Chondrus crispus]